jgi:hypothetical protein
LILPFVIISFIALGLIIGDAQNNETAINEAAQEKKESRKKSEAAQFYSSTAWRKARVQCFKLQLQRTGLNHIECEVCGSTSMDFDESGKRIVMSVGHDRARSTHPHLALDQNNLFPQCMPCNLGQGIEPRLEIGYNIG